MRKDTQIMNVGRLTALLLGLACAAGARADGTETYTGNLPWAVATADFNGDGMQDLAVVNLYDNNVSVLMNATGSGSTSLSMAAAQDFDVGAGPEGVTVADVNGDGKPDLIVANGSDYTVSVLINTTVPGSPTASFALQQTFTVGDGPDCVVVADVNGDGLPDIITSNINDNMVSVLLNTTTGGSATASFSAVQTFAVGNTPWALTASDLNRDGKPDLAVLNMADNTLSVLINTTPNGSATASFTAQQVFAAGNEPQSVAAGDINGDGSPDLVIVGAGDNSVSVFLNTTAAASSTAAFATVQTFSAASSSYSVKLADVNGDGLLDVVVADAGTASAAVLVNTTSIGSSVVHFAAEQDFSADSGWSSAVVVEDMNGDGIPEISLVNAGDGSANIMLNATSPGDTTLSFVP